MKLQNITPPKIKTKSLSLDDLGEDAPVELILDNVYLKVNNMTKDQMYNLWAKLSFPVEEFGSMEVRYRHLFNRKTKKTYAGLLQDVIDYCKECHIAYKLIDTRIKPISDADYSLVKEINGNPLKIRDYQKEVIDICNPREVIQAATGAGKAMPLDTPILTPNGFVPLSDIHVGDTVFDGFGKPTKVIGEYPQGKKEEWLITFRDGSTVKCCKDHLWKFMSNGIREHSAQWRVATIEEMVSKYRVKVPGHGYTLSIPVCKPIQFPKKELPIPPYALGVLLGDGGFTGRVITFTNPEDDILDKLNESVKEFGFFKRRKDTTHIQKHFVGGRNNPLTNYIWNTFKGTKSGEKFIPQEYLTASEEDRLELLRGLIDTDGHVDEKGHVSFGTTSVQLAKDVYYLILSLGYRASLKIGKRFYKDRNVTTDDCSVRVCGKDNKLFSSKKHNERFAKAPQTKGHYYDLLKIVNVEKTGKFSEMKCIAVDSEDHTFICNDFIVTHNTLIMAALIAKFKVSPVCVFADKISLCVQLKQEFQKFLGREIGFIGDGIYEPKDITVMSIQSADIDIAKQANMILFDECCPYYATVLLANGTYTTIGNIVERMEKGDHFDVITYNTTRKFFESKPITNYSKIPIGDRKMCKIFVKTANHEKTIITCTNNHKIWVDNRQEYIRADWILYGEDIITTKISYKSGDTIYQTYHDLYKATRAKDYYTIIEPIVGKVYDFQYVHDDDTEYVYDITVADNHNFVTNDAVVSNCHHVPADTFLKVATECTNAYYRIGVSATPWRDSGDSMLIDALLTKRDPSKAITASKLIQLGYLIRPYIYFVPISGRFSGKNYAKLYEQAIVDNMNRNKIICKIAYQMYKRNRTILLLIKYVRHGEFLYEKLCNILGKKETKFIYNDNGTEVEETVANIEFLSGDDSIYRRQVVFEGVKRGYCTLIISSTIADEGLDLPKLDTLILAGGGKSSCKAYQRIGRVMRLYPGKNKCFVFDFDDETPIFHRHARCRRKLYEEEEEFVIKDFEVTV